MHVINKTPFQVATVPTVCHQDTNHLVIVIKASFDMNIAQQGLSLCNDQQDVLFEEVYWGEPGKSSLRYEADIALQKLQTDIIVNATAYAEKGTARTLDTGISIGALQKVVRVFGDRYWEKKGIGYGISHPQVFEKMPVIYENAYGGSKLDVDKGICVGDERNPVGKGYVDPAAKQPEQGQPLPNLENPVNLIRDWRDRPDPWGYGFIARHWAPRKTLTGTYDAQWSKGRSPLLPSDFDPHSYNSASQGLKAQHYFEGGEPVKLVNLSLSGPISFTLPYYRFNIESYVNNRRNQHQVVLDTILIEPDELRVYMTWRTSFQVHWNLAMIEWIKVSSPEGNLI